MSLLQHLQDFIFINILLNKICNGASDPSISLDSIRTMQEEMTNASVDWEFNNYGSSMHGFTESTITAYNPKADFRFR